LRGTAASSSASCSCSLRSSHCAAGWLRKKSTKRIPRLHFFRPFWRKIILRKSLGSWCPITVIIHMYMLLVYNCNWCLTLLCVQNLHINKVYRKALSVDLFQF
jgi:hypothetical protein